jgi:hypothetical protein
MISESFFPPEREFVAVNHATLTTLRDRRLRGRPVHRHRGVQRMSDFQKRLFASFSGIQHWPA